jgi:hypothetical protein
MNKSTAPEEDGAWVERAFGAGSLVGVIPWDSRIGRADREGRSLLELGQELGTTGGHELLAPFRALQAALESQIARQSKEHSA